jgi:hypothetical protein
VDVVSQVDGEMLYGLERDIECWREV